MVNNSCKYLAWDSDFFKKKIFRVEIKKEEEISKLSELFNSVSFDLMYVFSTIELNLNFTFNFFLADKKIIFYKKISPNSDRVQIPEIISVSKTSNQLYELAFLSGAFSRFKLDPILSDKFEQLYMLWLEKSLSKEIASEVFVYNDGNNEIGFITIKKVENLAIIGLLAVDTLYAGKNIGTSLMRTVENWCINNGVNEIEVATQIDNINACNFYRKNGYITKQIDYIYHYYSEK